MPRVLLCPSCKQGQHTSPPEASLHAICQCGERTCACYGVQVRAGIVKDRGFAHARDRGTH